MEATSGTLGCDFLLILRANKTLHWAGNPLRFIAASELGRWVAHGCL